VDLRYTPFSPIALKLNGGNPLGVEVTTGRDIRRDLHAGIFNFGVRMTDCGICVPLAQIEPFSSCCHFEKILFVAPEKSRIVTLNGNTPSEWPFL
jgi:aerobic-type carbon monoxide dehydrogenase small subunit (CoxS/CutS family)